MRKRILAYIKYMNELLDRLEAEQKTKKDSFDPAEAEKLRAELERIKAEHLTQIAFFQHERLVHELVMILFALLTVGGILFLVVVPEISVLALDVLFFALLVPYVKHYYGLENGVQRLYDVYEKLEKL